MVQDAGWNVSHFVHIPSGRKEDEAREERIISSVKKQYQVAAYTISIMFHWQAVCFVYNGLNLILQKTRQMAIERQLSVSARMVMLFMKFYSEGEVGNMEVAGWGSGQGRGIVLFFKRKEVSNMEFDIAFLLSNFYGCVIALYCVNLTMWHAWKLQSRAEDIAN